MITTTPVLTTHVELAFLAGLLGVPALIGIPDPFWGRLAHEIEESLEQARGSLVDRNIIHVNHEGVLSVDEAVAALVRACGAPERTYILTAGMPDQEPVVHFFHLTSRGLAELTPAEGTAGLALLPDSAALFDRAVALGRIGGQAPHALPGCTLSASVLEHARLLASEAGPADTNELLQRAGLPPETAAALAQTLAAPGASLSLALASPGPAGWVVEGIGLLADETSLWLLSEGEGEGEEDGGREVHISACTADEAKEALSALIFRG
jgi:hypothetical protein